MLFTKSKNIPQNNQTVSTSNGTTIERVTKYKYLGIWICHVLCFNIHVFRFFVMFSGSYVFRFLVMFFPLSLSFTQVTCFLFRSCTSSLITSPQYLVFRFPKRIAKSFCQVVLCRKGGPRCRLKNQKKGLFHNKGKNIFDIRLSRISKNTKCQQNKTRLWIYNQTMKNKTMNK